MDLSSLNKGDWQNFIYLALLIVVMASGLFSRRELNFSKVFKYLGIWALIGLVAIITFSYRHEFSDLKERIISELNPSAVRENKAGQLVINISQDGHFYIDLKINGKMMRFMVDTGASDIVINFDEAQRLGIGKKSLIFNKAYQTANGTSWGASIILDEIELGNIKFHNVPASVNSADMGISLLGMSFLRQFDKYEFYRDKLILTIEQAQ